MLKYTPYAVFITGALSLNGIFSCFFIILYRGRSSYSSPWLLSSPTGAETFTLWQVGTSTGEQAPHKPVNYATI
jgi:hypothetical protein